MLWFLKVVAIIYLIKNTTLKNSLFLIKRSAKDEKYALD